MSYRHLILDDAPSGYWRLGEREGPGEATDLSVHGRHGTYVGSPSLDTPALVESSNPSTYLGLGEYVGVPGGGVYYGPDEAISLEWWYRWDGGVIPSAARFVWWGALSNVPGISLYSSGDGRLRLQWSSVGDTFTGLRGTYDIRQPGVWHYLAVTASRTDGARVYAQAVEQGAPAPTPLNSTVSTSDTHSIGGRPNSAQECPGYYAHVACYPYVMTPAQIQTHYDAGVVQAPGLLGVSRPGGWQRGPAHLAVDGYYQELPVYRNVNGVWRLT